MAMQRAGISIPLAITDLEKQIKSIRRKTSTLVDYYIYPDPTPSEISAYDPRLALLSSRLAHLDKISYTHLAYLIDDSDALAASYLEDIIIQLLNAIHGIQVIFFNHYDRLLEEREPFKVIYMVLEHREKQLQDLKRDHFTNPQRMKAEDLRSNEAGQFCRGAIQMLNGRDRGKLSYVTERELLPENRARLEGVRRRVLCGGSVPAVRFSTCGIMSPIPSTQNIHSTDEVRGHSGIPVEYKSAYLTKCHLFQPRSPGNSLSRRNSFFGGRGSHGSLAGVPKYGCGFCFALGRNLELWHQQFQYGTGVGAAYGRAA